MLEIQELSQNNLHGPKQQQIVGNKTSDQHFIHCDNLSFVFCPSKTSEVIVTWFN